MDEKYREITDICIELGRILRGVNRSRPLLTSRKNNIVTTYDYLVEDRVAAFVSELGTDHSLYSEETHTVFPTTRHVWALDPISGTQTFVDGLPHYSIVLTHLTNGVAEFAVVHDPSVQAIYQARKGCGFSTNLQDQYPTCPLRKIPRVLIHVSKIDNTSLVLSVACKRLSAYNLIKNTNSWAVNYAMVASGQFDGFISFSKDAFPEFAGSLLIRESGGEFKSLQGVCDVQYSDRVFWGGRPEIMDDLETCCLTILKNLSTTHSDCDT